MKNPPLRYFQFELLAETIIQHQNLYGNEGAKQILLIFN